MWEKTGQRGRRVFVEIGMRLCWILGWLMFGLWGAGWKVAAAAADRVADDIDALARWGYLDEPAYWKVHAVEGQSCEGEKVATLLVEIARVFEKTPDTEAALALLVKRGVISTPDYWRKTALAGGTCSGKNVATVISRCAVRLPVESPAYAGTAPLKAVEEGAIRDAYDIVIAGAGTGGVGAAVQAARMGRSVLLLEETDWIGGQAMAAAVTSMDEAGTLVRERGVYREFCGLVFAHYLPLGINPNTAYGFRHVAVEPRVGRQIFLTMLAAARGEGVLDLALLTRVVSVKKQGNVVTGVEIESGLKGAERRRKVACKVLIDATEWGDVLPLTGARYRVGNGTNESIDRQRRVQANTWTAVVKQYPEGVPTELLIREKPPGYTEAVHAAFARTLVDGDDVGSHDRPWSWARFIGYRGMPDSSRSGDAPPITRTHLNFNNDVPSTVAEIEDPRARLAKDREMRLKTLHLLYFIQNTLGKTDWSVANDEGYDSPFNRAAIDAWLAERPDLMPFREVLIHFSIIPYVRESRRLIGQHTLTAREIERKPGPPIQFATTVALGDYPMDLHGGKAAEDLELDLDRLSDADGKLGSHGVGPFAIPLECFIPEKLDGFLPAEKNLSQSRLVNGATRLQPSTMLTGQAAGALAGLAVELGLPPRQVDPARVQQVLLEAGDTLSLDDVEARWGTPEWRQQQTEVLQRGAPTSEGAPR